MRPRLVAAGSGPYVSVPASYVYNLVLGKRHDDCSNSPDEFPALFAANANFRGPCISWTLVVIAR